MKTLTTKLLKSILFTSYLFALTALTSCDKDSISTLLEDSNETIIKLDTDDCVPTGDPIVLPDDDFVMTYITGSVNEESTVYCFNNKGEILWRTTLYETPKDPIYNNGQIILACQEYVYALNSDDGSENWKYKITGDGMYITKVIYKPCITSEGNIILCLDSYILEDLVTAVPAKMVCLNPSGNLNWEQTFAAKDNYWDRFTKFSAPIANSNGIYSIVHISGSNGTTAYLKQFNSTNGSLIENYILDDYINCKLHCSNKNGDIFFSGDDDINFETKFFALSSTFEEKWSVSYGNNSINNHAVIDNDGNIYLSVEDGFLYKYSADGSELFASNLQKIFVRGEMLIANDGNIYKSCQGVEKINPQTGKSTSIPIEASSLSDISILSDGTIIYSGIGEMYMLPSDAKGISSNAQWPSYGANLGNTSYCN